MITTTIRSFL